MRIKHKPSIPLEWKRWFAWYPIELEDETVWLDFVERKQTYKWIGYEYQCTVEYRDVKPK